MGSGIQYVYGSWRDFGLVPPQIINNTAENSFTLRLSKEPLLSEEQVTIRARYGLNLNKQEARIFAMASRQEQVTYFDIRSVTGLDRRDAQPLLDRLVMQVALQRIPAHPEDYFRLAEHLRPPAPTIQPATSIPTGPARPPFVPSNLQVRILQFCSSPRKITEIKQAMNSATTSSNDYREWHILPLLDEGLLELVDPTRPAGHSRQQFLVTAHGNEIVAMRYTSKADPPAQNPTDE